MERLSGLDASFLYLETPQMHMHVAIAAVLDPSTMPDGYSYEALVELIEGRIHLVPPFRRRLVPVPFSVHHPLWVDDPDFDIIHHVRRVALPAPGGPRELGAMAGRITSTPLDRSRPLWEVWVIEGLEDGRVAILVKVHHAAVDGTSGAGLMVHLFDLTKTPRKVRPRVAVLGEPIPDDKDLFVYALRSRLQQPAEFAKLAGRTIQKLRDFLAKRLDRSVPDGVNPFSAPRTHFNGALTARRDAAFARLTLNEIKGVKNALGCTVNDVVLAVCGGALRHYLQGRDELPSAPLIATCPISVRGGQGGAAEVGEAANNRVSALFTTLATHLDDPLERLELIRETTKGAKVEHKAIGADMLQDWAEFAAPTTFNLASRFYARMKLAELHRPIHNVVISNVPGPPFPLYMAGAKCEAAYPLGPVMEGAGLNITVLSYMGNVDFGFMVAKNLVPDVWDLADAVGVAFQELSDAVAARQKAAS